MKIRADILAMPWDLYGLRPQYIAGVPDNFWVTCAATAQVVHLLPDRATEAFPVDATPEQIAVGGDNVWFTMPYRDMIGRIDADHNIHNYELGARPGYLVADEDGATVDTSDGPKSISSDGTVSDAETAPVPFDLVLTEFDDHSGKLRAALDGAAAIADDGEGGCWFTEIDDDLLGHLDAQLVLRQYDISEYGTRPRGLLVDSEGFPWIVLLSGGVIGVIPADPPPPEPVII